MVKYNVKRKWSSIMLRGKRKWSSIMLRCKRKWSSIMLRGGSGQV